MGYLLREEASKDLFTTRNKKPLEYADVKVLGTNPLKAFSTKENGYFVIQNIPAGTYEVVVEEFYHETFTKTITFKKGKSQNEKFYLQEANVIEGVDVVRTKERTPPELESMIKITKTKQIPTTGGDADIASYFEYRCHLSR